MGFRRRIKLELRHGLRLAQARWETIQAPFYAQRDRERMASIHALERVKELVLPVGIERGHARLVLFSHYHPKGWLQVCIRRELADLRNRGWQVLLLTDALDRAGREWCQSHGLGLLRRRNEGRDFGAFQDAWLTLQQRGLGPSIDRLILLNDSVYPITDLSGSSWPRFLEGGGDLVLGFSDSFQNGYHLQSYGLHLPGTVLQQPWWTSYWSCYRGWGGMSVAIRDGEIGLSQLLLNQGIGLRALHPVSRLRAQLASAELLEKLQVHCSREAAVWIQMQLLETGMSSVNYYSPCHYWAIPLLLDGCPFVKRWLLESNEQQMLDPLLVAKGQEAFVNPDELADYLRPPVIGFAS